jgi:hypothetical protein
VSQIETTDGKFLPNATVVRIDPATNAVLKGMTVEGGSERIQTDRKGQFSFSRANANVHLVVANDEGFSLAQSLDLIESAHHPRVKWGCVPAQLTQYYKFLKSRANQPRILSAGYAPTIRRTGHGTPAKSYIFIAELILARD